MLNLSNILKELSDIRPVFRSETDFQEALFQKITEMTIKCEKNKIVNGTKVDL